jgi:putative proteasome-type protease
VVTAETALGKAAKCALISFASTLRSNVTVGMPIDLLLYRRDSLKVDFRRRYQPNDPYFERLGSVFNEGIIRVFDGLPDPV